MPLRPSITLAVQSFQVARFGIWFLLSIALATLDPGKALISQYETLVLLGASLSFFWTSGLFDTFIPLASKAEGLRTAALTGQALRISNALAAAVAGGMLLWARLAFPGLDWHIVLPFCIYQLFHLASLPLEQIWILRRQGLGLLLTGIPYYAALALILAGGMALRQPLAFCFAAMAGLAALRWLAQNVMLWRQWSAKAPQGHSWELARAAFPISLAALLGGGAAYVDSNLVRAFFPEGDFVNFTYGARELPLALLLANSLSMVKSGEIAAARGEEQLGKALASLRASAARTQHLVFPVALALMASSQWLVVKLLGPTFEGVHLILDITLLLVIPRMIFPQAVVKAYLKGWALTWVSLAELALNVILSLVLMQFWGMAGIAVATVVAYLAEKVFLAIYAKARLGIGFAQYTPMAIWLAYSTMLCIGFAVKARLTF